MSETDVVLLHSLGLDGSAYDVLREHLPGVQLHLPDLRGHGVAATVEPPTLAGMTADVTRFLARFEGPVHLVGHSLGGAVAGLVASQRPELVTSLVVVASPPRGLPVFAERARDTLELGMPAQVEETLERWFGPRPSGTVVDLARERLERVAPRTWAALWTSFAQFPSWSELALAARVRSRTLCVAYPGDLSTPPEVVAQIVSAAGGARMVVAAEGGHLGPLEHPDGFAALLRGHLLKDQT